MEKIAFLFGFPQRGKAKVDDLHKSEHRLEPQTGAARPLPLALTVGSALEEQPPCLCE